MYGWIHACTEDLVVSKCGGTDTWRAVLREADLEEDRWENERYYDDKVIYSIVAAASKVLGVPGEKVLEAFGEHFVHFAVRSEYDRLLRSLGSTFEGFLNGLDRMHKHLAQNLPSIVAPGFWCERDPDRPDERVLLLHYISNRAGLYPMVPSLCKEVARRYYDFELEVEIAVPPAVMSNETHETVFSLRAVGEAPRFLNESAHRTQPAVVFGDDDHGADSAPPSSANASAAVPMPMRCPFTTTRLSVKTQSCHDEAPNYGIARSSSWSAGAGVDGGAQCPPPYTRPVGDKIFSLTQMKSRGSDGGDDDSPSTTTRSPSFMSPDDRHRGLFSHLEDASPKLEETHTRIGLDDRPPAVPFAACADSSSADDSNPDDVRSKKMIWTYPMPRGHDEVPLMMTTTMPRIPSDEAFVNDAPSPSIPPSLLHASFVLQTLPYHVVFSHSLRVLSVGSLLQRLMPELLQENARMDKVFTILAIGHAATPNAPITADVLVRACRSGGSAIASLDLVAMRPVRGASAPLTIKGVLNCKPAQKGGNSFTFLFHGCPSALTLHDHLSQGLFLDDVPLSAANIEALMEGERLLRRNNDAKANELRRDAESARRLNVRLASALQFVSHEVRNQLAPVHAIVRDSGVPSRSPKGSKAVLEEAGAPGGGGVSSGLRADPSSSNDADNNGDSQTSPTSESTSSSDRDDNASERSTVLNALATTSDILNNVLAIARLKAGDAEVPVAPFALGQWIHAVERFGHQLMQRRRGAASRVEFHSKVVDVRSEDVASQRERPRHLHVLGCQTWLKQIATNLLSNAAKFTQQGEVRATWTVSSVATEEGTESSMEHVHVRMIVEDTGCGMMPEEIPRVLEEFGQTRTGRDAQTGTGLGLPLSKRMAEAMGGSFRLTSEPGIGTTVQVDITLPLSDKPCSSPPDRQDAHPFDALPILRDRTVDVDADVLAVEDNEVLARLYTRKCMRLNLTCKVVSDGDEAVDLAANGLRYGLVLMDMEMVRMNGDRGT